MKVDLSEVSFGGTLSHATVTEVVREAMKYQYLQVAAMAAQAAEVEDDAK